MQTETESEPAYFKREACKEDRMQVIPTGREEMTLQGREDSGSRRVSSVAGISLTTWHTMGTGHQPYVIHVVLGTLCISRRHDEGGEEMEVPSHWTVSPQPK